MLHQTHPESHSRYSSNPPRRNSRSCKLWCGIWAQAALAVFLLALSVVSLSAQTGPRVAADASWKDLVVLTAPPSDLSVSSVEGVGEVMREKRRADTVTRFLSAANAAKSFAEKYPEDTRARESNLIEAENLLKAAMSGSKDLRSRIDPLIKSIASDKALPSSARFKIVAMSEYLLLKELAAKPELIPIAREDSARFLIREFPDQAGGYMALLAAARIRNDSSKIKAAVGEVISSETAPFMAKAQARILAGRYNLVGKSLADVANTALGRDSFFEAFRSKKTILYTWSSEAPSSIEYLKNLAGKLSKDVSLIGYNLDRKTAIAADVARAESLPGAQYYNDGGTGSQLALLLKLDAPGMVYVTDEVGIIRSVSGLDQLNLGKK